MLQSNPRTNVLGDVLAAGEGDPHAVGNLLPGGAAAAGTRHLHAGSFYSNFTAAA
jgi:hypothetical protein